MGIHPRNASQLDHAKMSKSPAMSGGGPLHTITSKNTSDLTKEIHAAELEKTGIPIILNPFFTSIWPQDPTNMTSSPYLTTIASASPQTATWRRMHLTSPPVLQVDLNLWYTKANGRGNQMNPSTGKVPSGVKLGHLADLLGAQPKKLKLHWMQIHGHEWWVRSADAVVVPKEGDVGDNNARKGVYMNPSNGIAFPGAF